LINPCFPNQKDSLPKPESTDDNLFRVFGFKDKDTATQPSEITPTIGDTFTITCRWLDLNSSGQAIQESFDEGGILTFSGEGFTGSWLMLLPVITWSASWSATWMALFNKHARR
jgi:hypothetical protein